MATREVSDGTRTVERWTNVGTPGYYTGNPLTKQRDLTTAETNDLAAMDANNARLTNASTLQSRLQAALAANANFQAIASPTNAQNAAYLQTVAKELNGLLRLALNQLDDTTGT